MAVNLNEYADIKALEELLNHSFSDRQTLETALTHSSTGAKHNYERLEFLGDRVLGLVIAELLYARFPKENEGDMAKRLAALVQGEFLASIAREIDLGRFIRFSESEAASGGGDNDHILADVFESTIGALYLDSGFEKCRLFIEKLWGQRLDVMVKPPQHPKTRVQEWAQAESLPLPEYTIVAQDGPDHAPIFHVELKVEGFDPVTAQGRSRQVAEKEAATAFMNSLKGKKK
ncbi:MAG: ribonuclease III [Micavibrio sp.]|nr:ribonuclease III [Micavibrio sp.]